MNPELSMRVTQYLPFLQATLEPEEYWALQDELLNAESFESLSEETQAIIQTIEENRI